MLERLLDFTAALRRAGVPAGTSEQLDSLRALAHVDMHERESLRAALAATTVKSEAHRPAFDTLFDLYFAVSPAPGEPPGHGDDLPSFEPLDAPDPRVFAERVFAAIVAGDDDALRDLALRAVERFGRVEHPLGGSPYFTYLVFRSVDVDEILARLMLDLAGSGLSPLEERLRGEELEERLRRFRDEVEAEVRRRLVQHKGAEHVAKHAVKPLPEDLDFVRASAEEIAQLRRAVVPLARRLATRLALQRKRSRRGRLDVRRTVRASLSTGGVPFDTRHRRRTPHRPELFVLCDVSGSVAAFARFTLMFVHAFQAQFSRVRSFVFVDTLDEVTHLFEHEDFIQAVDRINREARVVWLDGHSDYGTSLERFWERYGDSVGPRASVLVLGDARNNYRSSGAWVIKALKRKARRVYWLNPEPRLHWGTGDSITDEYAAHADGMLEVRNLRQLEEFIAKIV